ncbi:uncharacterized protein ASPGLDRAFT_31920 [Aspergillus glaucus CBS 516.65]|uniref:Uncharacterized protein n=1 Tax=Aspergillus glaucus CBS 516.65 TaxID=1160497 RepID=A0A1L9VY34_ASPGL|nr:hypothetical protein ASPGLDRAFT_31920 [Aspergillus glaucus CBS 516.65]OJJ88812.1 hypothetical protein ASPGLDRAFT_31920 [Aspergillus glaucus CBS 516.65]
MAVPGVLMRLSNITSLPPADLPTPISNVEAIYTLKADDGKTPSHNTVYFLSDITPLLSSEAHYNADAAAHRELEASSPALSWVVCSFINGRDTAGHGEPQTSPRVPSAPPAPGSVVVVNGSTPNWEPIALDDNTELLMYAEQDDISSHEILPTIDEAQAATP